MTDKQMHSKNLSVELDKSRSTATSLIIDGVDVSGCEFLIISKEKQMCRCIKSDLFGGIEFVKNAKNGICKDNPNCYYKQLKAKEQECEELKEDKIYLQDRVGKLKRAILRRNDKLDQLKAENEELKKELEAVYDDCKGCPTCDEALYNAHLYAKECRKLKQTFEEIKPILEYYENSKIGEKQEDGSYKLEFTFSDIATPYCIHYDPKPAREALRKINEVENGN